MSDNNIKENLKYYIEKKGWSLPKLAKKSEIPLDTLKGMLYRNSKGSRIFALVKLANILECTVEELVNPIKSWAEFSPRYTNIYNDCNTYVCAYLERKKILLDSNHLNKICFLLYSLIEKKHKKNIEYDIDDDIIEWLLENF